MSIAPQPDFSREFADLTASEQASVIEFIRGLEASRNEQLLTGEARRQAILELAGSIPSDDIALMMAAIEADCARIDADG